VPAGLEHIFVTQLEDSFLGSPAIFDGELQKKYHGLIKKYFTNVNLEPELSFQNLKK
jgi:hypothetical protein